MATVKFYLENINATTQTSINLMFTVDRSHRVKVRTDEKLHPKYWSKQRQRVKPSKEGHIIINRYLDDLELDVQTYYRNNRKLEWQRLAESIKLIVKGQQINHNNFEDAYAKYMEVAASTKSQLTIKKYEGLLLRLHKFSQTYNRPLSLESIDMDFYYKFTSYLYNWPNPRYTNCKLIRIDDHYHIVDNTDKRPGHPVGLFDETVSKYIDEIKTFMAWCVEHGYTTNKQYGRFKSNRRTSLDIVTLTEHELIHLYHYPYSSEAMIKSRDLFCLECFTGQRISNIKRFDKSQLKNNLWAFRVHKGKRLYQKDITLLLEGFMAPALAILKKYDYKLPSYSDQVLNRNIKKAAEIAGIDAPVVMERYAANKCIKFTGPKYKYLSTHTGRRSFINILLNKNVPPKVISDYTGQTQQTIMKYYTDRTDLHTMRSYLTQVGDITKNA